MYPPVVAATETMIDDSPTSPPCAARTRTSRAPSGAGATAATLTTEVGAPAPMWCHRAADQSWCLATCSMCGHEISLPLTPIERAEPVVVITCSDCQCITVTRWISDNLWTSWVESAPESIASAGGPPPVSLLAFPPWMDTKVTSNTVPCAGDIAMWPEIVPRFFIRRVLYGTALTAAETSTGHNALELRADMATHFHTAKLNAQLQDMTHRYGTLVNDWTMPCPSAAESWDLMFFELVHPNSPDPFYAVLHRT